MVPPFSVQVDPDQIGRSAQRSNCAAVNAKSRHSFLVGTLAAGLGSLLWRRYRADLRRARERVAQGSSLASTACGPIEFAEAGRGSPLLVVHGAGGGFDQGLELAGSLPQRGFRVIAMSRFGYLRTPLPANASAAAQADAHACLLDALGIWRAAIMGVSAGAPSAMQFAIRHPDRCQALVLMVPLAYKPPELTASAPARSPGSEKVLTTMIGSDFAFWLASKVARESLIEMVLGTPAQVVRSATAGEQMRIDRLIEDILPVSRRADGLLNDGRIATALPRYELERIAAPSLIISARDDLYGTFASAQYTATQIRNASFVDFKAGGHILADHDEETSTRIQAFLSSVETASNTETAPHDEMKRVAGHKP